MAISQIKINPKGKTLPLIARIRRINADWKRTAFGYWPLAKGNGRNRKPTAAGSGLKNPKANDKIKKPKPKAKNQEFIEDQRGSNSNCCGDDRGLQQR